MEKDNYLILSIRIAISKVNKGRKTIFKFTTATYPSFPRTLIDMV
jgi:hypothetical protein